MEHKQFNHQEPFVLESGQVLPRLQIVYSYAGTISPTQDNVIWVCHALTANSNVADWWSGLIGSGKLFDPAHHFIIFYPQDTHAPLATAEKLRKIVFKILI